MLSWLARLLLGFSTSLGGTSLDYGGCYVKHDFAERCEFDARRCEAGCGAELTAFTERIEAYNDGVVQRGRRHGPGWALRLRGRIPLDWSEPWELTADRVRIDCQSALLYTSSSEVPIVSLDGVSVTTGQTILPLPAGLSHQAIRPGDILLGPDGWQVPIAKSGAGLCERLPKVCNVDHDCALGGCGVGRAHVQLGFGWQGPDSSELGVSTGRLIRMQGEATSMPDVCPVYATGRARWRPEREGHRTTPASAISTDGWDIENGFCTQNFDHPGDYHHANVSASAGGGTNGARLTGCASNNGPAIAAHGEQPRAHGALVLSLAGVLAVDFRQQMNAGYRGFLIAGNTHKLELRGEFEGAHQILWAPEGCSSCSLEGMFNHQNNRTSPRHLPWIDAGTRTGRYTSAFQVRFPHIFFQWGKGMRREVLFRARGNPVYLNLEGSARNLKRVLDVPEGSIVTGRFVCLDRPNGRCE
jgi:hypothetical protein